MKASGRWLGCLASDLNPMKKVAKKKKKAEPGGKNRGGRPTKFSAAVLGKICSKLENGTPMAVICRDETMPAVRTVGDWQARDKAVSASIARAREVGFDALAAECLEIADTPLPGVTEVTKEWGTEIRHEDMLGHRKLQIETRLKLLSKWDPKRYGEKVDLELTGDAVVKVIIGGDA